MGKVLDIIEGELRELGGPYLAGKEFSLADVRFSPGFESLLELGILDALLCTAKPRLKEWWELICKRKGWEKCLGHTEYYFKKKKKSGEKETKAGKKDQ